MAKKTKRNVRSINNQSTKSRVVEVERRVAVNHQQFSGPLPHPSILSEYDLVVPGLAAQIVAMAEKEQAHRHQKETSINNANIFIASNDSGLKKTGQWMAFVIAVLGMCISGLLVYKGHSIVGSILGGGFLVALTGIFFSNRSNKES